MYKGREITWDNIRGTGRWGFKSSLAGNIYGVLSAISKWGGLPPSELGIGSPEDDIYLIYGHYYAQSLIQAYNDQQESEAIRRRGKGKK